jgi:hypothetical protein
LNIQQGLFFSASKIIPNHRINSLGKINIFLGCFILALAFKIEKEQLKINASGYHYVWLMVVYSEIK